MGDWMCSKFTYLFGFRRFWPKTVVYFYFCIYSNVNLKYRVSTKANRHPSFILNKNPKALLGSTLQTIQQIIKTEKNKKTLPYPLLGQCTMMFHIIHLNAHSPSGVNKGMYSVYKGSVGWVGLSGPKPTLGARTKCMKPP